MLTISKVNFNKTCSTGVSNNNYQYQQSNIHSQINKDTVSFGRFIGCHTNAYSLGGELSELRHNVVEKLFNVVKTELKEVKYRGTSISEYFTPGLVSAEVKNINKDGSKVLIQGTPISPRFSVVKNGEETAYDIPQCICSNSTIPMSKEAKGVNEPMWDEKEIKGFIDTIKEALESENSESRIVFGK